MSLDVHGYSQYHENKHEAEVFSSLQESYKPLESYFCVLMVSLEDNMMAGTNHINDFPAIINGLPEVLLS